MLSAFANPISRFAFRYSTAWLRLLPLAPAIVLESDRRAPGRSARVALIALCYAAPLAVAYVLEAEHGGQLDQIRLSGQPPWRIAMAALRVSSLWFAIAAIAIIWTLIAGEATPNVMVGIIAIAGIPTTLAVMTWAAPLVRQVLDPRIGMAASCVLSVAIGAAMADLLRSGPWITQFLIVIAIEAVLLARYLPAIPARMAHAPVARSSRRWSLHVPGNDLLYRWPGFYRGLSLGSSGIVLFFLFAPMFLTVAWLNDRPPSLQAIAFGVPIAAIGAISISLICREDVTCGRLEIVRSSSRPSWAACFEMAAGLWTPFLLSAIAVTALAASVAQLPLETVITSIVMLIALAPLPFIEGWTQAWPMMIIVPAALGFITVGWIADAKITAMMIGAAFWAGAFRAFDDTRRAVSPRGLTLLIYVALCVEVAVVTRVYDAMISSQLIAVSVFALAPVVIDPYATRGRQLSEVLTLSAALTLTAAYRTNIAAGISAGAVGAFAWYSAYRIRLIDPDHPAIQATIRILAMVTLAQLSANSLRSVNWFFDPSDRRAQLIVGAAVAAMAEIGYRIWWLLEKRRTATLPS